MATFALAQAMDVEIQALADIKPRDLLARLNLSASAPRPVAIRAPESAGKA